MSDVEYKLADQTFSPLMTFQPCVPSVLTLHGKNGVVASINMDDGTVTLPTGAAEEAAEIFWNAVSTLYQTVLREREELKLRVHELECKLDSIEYEEYGFQ